MLPVCHNLNYINYREELSDVLPNQQSHQKLYKTSSRRVTVHGDKLYDILQAMAPTNVETIHQKSLFHIESNLDRLGSLSPTHSRPAFSATKRTNHAPISFDQQAQVSQGRASYEIRKIGTEVHGGGGLELIKPAREPASSRPKSCSTLKKPHESCPFATPCWLFVGRNQTVVRHQLFPQKPLGSRLCLSRTGVQHSPGSSTIELPSALAESGAYPSNRAPPGSSRQSSLPLACRHLPKCTKLELGRGAHLETPSTTNQTVAASQPIG